MKTFIEYLSRIQCLLVIIENVQYVRLLQTTSETITIKFQDLSSDDIPCHEQEANLKLPGNYSLTDENIDFQPYKDNSFQLRLKATCNSSKNPQAEISAVNTGGFYDGIPEKWCRKDLSTYDVFQFNCSNCKQKLFDNSDYPKLSDMPSEHWEELMDYWHCHKPHIDDDTTHNIYSTKYNNKLKPTSSELLLGGSYMLCLPHIADRTDKTVYIDQSLVKCSECHYELGTLTNDNLIKLNKWNLVLETEGTQVTFDPIDEILMSLVIFSVEQSGRYTLVHHGTDRILLWLFNIGLSVTVDNSYSLNNSMKVLYTTDEGVIEETMKRHNVDEITTQRLPFTRCISEFQLINDKLPSPLQRFGHWYVSYMEMYNHRQ